MLNGLYPVLLFYTTPADVKARGKFLPPLPVYLDETATKLALESESESLDIATESLADVKDGEVSLVQKGLTQRVNIELKAREDDAILGMILPVLKNIASDVIAANEYKIAYFHRDMLIFNAKLAGYEKSPESGTNLIRLSITLEVKPEQKKKEDKQPTLEYSNKEPGLIGTSGPSQGLGGGSLSKQAANKVALTPVTANASGTKEMMKNFPKLIERKAVL